MRRIQLRLFTCVTLGALIVGCQPSMFPGSPGTAGTVPNTEVAATPDVTALIPGTATLTETPTLVSTVMSTVMNTAINTVAETSTVPETAMANTALPSATVAISATGEVSATTPTPATASAAPMLMVIITSLRIRSGPGMEYSVLGAATQGEYYPIVGQAYDCQWYQVTHPRLGAVWMAGDVQYTSSNTRCDQIPAVAIPTPPVAFEPVLRPTSPPIPTQSTPDPLPGDKGCLVLQNQLGPSLTFTFTRADSSWRDTLEVAPEANIPYCLVPGRYRVTIDAPPPWLTWNMEIEINAGEHINFPIRPQ